MIFGDFGLLMDGVVSILLVTVIFYAIRLNSSLATLKANRAELEQLIANFTESTNRAEASVGRLKSTALETANSLQSNVTRAQELRDDLTFMSDRANEIADRLEVAIGDSRRSAPSRTDARVSGARDENLAGDMPRVRRGEGGQIGDQDEREKSKTELLRALQGMR